MIYPQLLLCHKDYSLLTCDLHFTVFFFPFALVNTNWVYVLLLRDPRCHKNFQLSNDLGSLFGLGFLSVSLILFVFPLSSIVSWKWTSNCSSSNTKRRCVNKLKSFQVTITRNLHCHAQSFPQPTIAISAKHTVQAWTPGRRVFNKQTRLWERQQGRDVTCLANETSRCLVSRAHLGLAVSSTSSSIRFCSVWYHGAVTQEKEMWLKETSELAPSPEQSPSSSPLSQLAKETKGTETKNRQRMWDV